MRRSAILISAISAPCKDCEKRRLGCHGKCEEYKAFRAELDALNERRRLMSAANEASRNIEFYSARRMEKRGRRKGR